MLYFLANPISVFMIADMSRRFSPLLYSYKNKHNSQIGESRLRYKIYQDQRIAGEEQNPKSISVAGCAVRRCFFFIRSVSGSASYK